MERHNHWIASWQNTASQKLERIVEQNNYEHDPNEKGPRELERVRIDGFNKCTLRMEKFLPENEIVDSRDDPDNSFSINEKEPETKQTSLDRRISDDPDAALFLSSECENPKTTRKSVSKVFSDGEFDPDLNKIE